MNAGCFTFDVSTFDGSAPSSAEAGLSYDAATTTKRRKPAATSAVQSEDRHLSATRRRTLNANAADLMRNYAVVGWAARKHLDFVAAHTLQVITPDKGLSRDVAERFERWGESPDVSGLFDFAQFVRAAELSRLLFGDVGMLYLSDRGRDDGKLQAIPGERVREPVGPRDAKRKPLRAGEQFVHGVRCNAQGRPLGFAVHRRTRGGRGLEFEAEIPAVNFHLLAYRDHFDQVRGVSPLAAGLNGFRDTYETADLAIVRAKVANLFGLVIYRDADDTGAPIDAQADAADDNGNQRYDVDFGAGPITLDLDPGDKADFLKNETGSVEHGELVKLVLSLALRCLDLPWSIFDEAATNYSGQRSAFVLYQQSAKAKRRELRRWLNRTARWKFAQWVRSGAVVLPRSVPLEAVRLQWYPDGIPWWDPSRETRAALLAIGAGLRTRTEVRRELYSDDWAEAVLPELEREHAAAVEAFERSGLVLADLSQKAEPPAGAVRPSPAPQTNAGRPAGRGGDPEGGDE